MIDLVISGTTYKLPTKQSEISYRMGKTIDDIVQEYPEMNVEGKKFILSTLIGVDYDVVDLITDEQISLIVDNHCFFQLSQLTGFPLYIKYKRKIYKYQDFTEKITVERYGDLDHLSMNGETERLFFSLYLPVKKRLRHFFLRNYKTIDEINYYIVRLAILFYYQYKQDLLNEYGLNYDNPNIPEDQLDKGGTIVLKETEKFGLYHILLNTTGLDYDSMLNWLQRDVRDLMKFLLYLKLNNMDKPV